MLSSFDLIYYTLAATIVLALGYTVLVGFKIRLTLIDKLRRDQIYGLSLAALGMGVSVIGGVLLTDLSRGGRLNDVFYQQARFSISYIGAALILYGIDSAVSAARLTDPFLRDERRWVLVRITVWTLFGAAIVIAAFYLFNSHTYTYTYSGNRQNAVQQQVFYLPLFAANLAGVVLALLSLRSKDPFLRRHLIWVSLFPAFVVVGLLREAMIIPVLGNPLIDMLVAFIPFTLAAISLCVAVRSLLPLHPDPAPTSL